MELDNAFIILPISTHALREEGDGTAPESLSSITGNFYPRPPRGGRLCLFFVSSLATSISTHALREEGDDVHEGAISA